MNERQEKASPMLRTGWTTGACATAATKAAFHALITGHFPDPVSIRLPKGETPSFTLAHKVLKKNQATAGIIKDAGDDPDVTHGALILSTVAFGSPGQGIVFCAGQGVGTVTRAGLPIKLGEAAINPIPRAMMRAQIEALCKHFDYPADVAITLSVPQGEHLAKHTWNPRLGIVGGISILGTTGIVHPFSCSAWISSIHRGIDVARAAGAKHIIAATGSTSEDAAQTLYHLPDYALIDMGDFVGAVLKYLRHHPIKRLTLAGGFAKFTKLAQGAKDLHSSRSHIDKNFLWQHAQAAGLGIDYETKVKGANTAKEILDLALQKGVDIALPIANAAHKNACALLRNSFIDVELMITDRQGKILATVG